MISPTLTLLRASPPKSRLGGNVVVRTQHFQSFILGPEMPYSTAKDLIVLATLGLQQALLLHFTATGYPIV